MDTGKPPNWYQMWIRPILCTYLCFTFPLVSLVCRFVFTDDWRRSCQDFLVLSFTAISGFLLAYSLDDGEMKRRWREKGGRRWTHSVLKWFSEAYCIVLWKPNIISFSVLLCMEYQRALAELQLDKKLKLTDLTICLLQRDNYFSK